MKGSKFTQGEIVQNTYISSHFPGDPSISPDWLSHDGYDTNFIGRVIDICNIDFKGKKVFVYMVKHAFGVCSQREDRLQHFGFEKDFKYKTNSVVANRSLTLPIHLLKDHIWHQKDDCNSRYVGKVVNRTRIYRDGKISNLYRIKHKGGHSVQVENCLSVPTSAEYEEYTSPVKKNSPDKSGSVMEINFGIEIAASKLYANCLELS